MSSFTATLDILGVPVTPCDSLEAAVECAHDRIIAGKKTFCIAINPEKIEGASHDPTLKRILAGSHLQLCDGIGVVLAALVLHSRKLVRCTGVDFLIGLARMASVEHLKVFLLGGRPDSNLGAQRRLLECFPELEISGWRDGYFDNSSEVVDQINASGAQILFVALGSPRQEFWIAERLNALRPVLCMGVGGSFDVLSGRVRRAPQLFRRTGTEWLFRLITEPHRARRQLALPAFLIRVAKEKLISQNRTPKKERARAL